MSHILLIDDDSITNFLNKKIIMKTGLAQSIQAFESGQEALAHLHAICNNETEAPFPDLILLDIMMPVMDGFEVLDELLKLPPKPLATLKVIMLSSSLDNRDRERAMENELVQHFLSKPLTYTSIKEVLS